MSIEKVTHVQLVVPDGVLIPGQVLKLTIEAAATPATPGTVKWSREEDPNSWMDRDGQAFMLDGLEGVEDAFDPDTATREETIEHDNIEADLAETRRVLEAGGSVTLAGPRADSLAEAGAVKDPIGNYGESTAETEPKITPSEWDKLLKKAGKPLTEPQIDDLFNSDIDGKDVMAVEDTEWEQRLRASRERRGMTQVPKDWGTGPGEIPAVTNQERNDRAELSYKVARGLSIRTLRDLDATVSRALKKAEAKYAETGVNIETLELQRKADKIVKEVHKTRIVAKEARIAADKILKMEEELEITRRQIADFDADH